ncbi:MAG TPA: CapA family protein [Thermomicrobiales bacterium]|nr:CapA family protein [Thermomicrobiales bacterium]
MHARPVTRRALLGALGSGAIALLAGCGTPGLTTATTTTGQGTRTPAAPPGSVVGTLLVEAPGGDPATVGFAQRLHDFLNEQVARGSLTTTGARLTVTSAAPSSGPQSKVSQTLAPVVHWRLPLDMLKQADLIGILNGTVKDWQQAGSPVAGTIERIEFTPGGTLTVPGVSTLLPPVASCNDYPTLVAALAAHPFAFAIVPLDVIDFQVRALAIDGMDPLAGRGDLTSYPLRHQLWLSWDEALGGGLRDAVNAFALSYGYFPESFPLPGNPINLTVAGDIIFGRTVHTRMVQYNDFAHPLRLVALRLKSADLTIADLECSMSDNTEKPTDPFTFLFTTNAAAVDGLTLAGIGGVSLANNHFMNFGALGMNDTIADLKAHGIGWFGAGANLTEARKPGMFNVKGLKVYFLGYDGISAAEYGARDDRPGTCPLTAEYVMADISAAKQAGADVIIPFFHWSEEYVAIPNPSMRSLAHLAIDYGATLVIGSHPHWVQATEWYKGVPILYSLGNFVFDQNWSIETMQGMFAEIVLRYQKPVRIRLVPVQIEEMNQPRIMEPGESLQVLQRVYAATDAVKAMG